MKTYLTAVEAQTMFDNGLETLEYPNQEHNCVEFPLIEKRFIPELGWEEPLSEPNNLISEAVSLFGREPQMIIDVGCGAGYDAMYLAAQGHYVTAMSPSRAALKNATDIADYLGIPKANFTPREARLEDLTASDKFQGVISLMLLHFFEERETRRAANTLQSVTLPGGINVISAYTNDNPPEEITDPERQLVYMFKPGQLASLYSRGWQTLRDREGYANKVTQRHFKPGQEVLIPTIAELIVQKATKHRTHMTANKEIIDHWDY